MEHFSECIRYWAKWIPDKTALWFQGSTVNWAELNHRTDALASGLASIGLGHGDRIGILLNNCPAYVDTVCAGIKLGLVIVPLNVHLTARELVHPIENSGLKVVVSEEAFADRLAKVVDVVPHQFTLYMVDGAEQSRQLGSLYLDSTSPSLESGSSEDALFLCYTAGTTGVQKGVLLTHHNVRAAGLAKVLAEAISHNDSLLLPYSLAFTGGVVSCLTEICLLSGATLVLEPDFDPERCLGLIADPGVTIITGVPIILERLARTASFDVADLSKLRSATTGGSAVSRWLLETYHNRGIQLTQSYGLTEASGGVTYLSSGDAARKMGSAGWPGLHNSIRTVDEKDTDKLAGEVGEIVVRGPSVMREYWNLPDATETALRGGWLHTGDVGFLDEEGYLTVVDRAKDMLISGGINVYPAEIESALTQVDGLEDFAVIGVPDERWGEVPMVVVGKMAGKLDVAALEMYCREELASFKRPKYVAFYDGPLPRNLGGKVLKAELRRHYLGVPDTAVTLRTSSADR